MAEFVPLQGPEKNSDASWYTSIGAGIVSGVLKTVGCCISWCRTRGSWSRLKQSSRRRKIL